MTPDIVRALLHNKESETLDFKREQYSFRGATKEQKAELLKDILAFANSWKTADAYILIGVDETSSGPAQVVGVTEHLDDADVQQLVNSNTQRPVKFLCGKVVLGAKTIDVICIDRDQDRPIVLRADYGRLKKDTVYLRRGSSTVVAGVDEIAEMGAARAGVAQRTPEIQFELANPSNRQRIGHSACVTSIVFHEPPPPSPPSRSLAVSGHLAEDADIDAQTLPIIKSVVDQVSQLGPMMQSMSHPLSMFRDPSPEQIREYVEKTALLTGVGFWATNCGSTVAADVRIEIRGDRPDSLVIVDEEGLPDEPEKSVLAIASIRTPAFSNTRVQTYDGYWVASVHVGKIQPGAEVWIEDLLYFGSKIPVVVEAIARVFADNLPTPEEIPLTIAIECQEKVYCERDFLTKDRDEDDH